MLLIATVAFNGQYHEYNLYLLLYCGTNLFIDNIVDKAVLDSRLV